ncbi:hypothetical protein ATANTOWER_016783 [Ataeniobius toweri]|uniref:Uncharacterized protein n=1 Tax=Ataeniobius toweri TaxID=208326 RepID=A0ABU7BJ28_9TELE|nr:hypothetical protein [Ataeniobius toweri]
MGVIYYMWTATCSLEFQAAYHSRDLPRSIFTFQLQLNRYDKHTQQKGAATAALHFHTATSRARSGFDAEVPDTQAEGAEQEGEKWGTEMRKRDGGKVGRRWENGSRMTEYVFELSGECPSIGWEENGFTASEIHP